VRSTSKGDLLCQVEIETPVKLDKQQKELLKQFNDSMENTNKNHSPQANSWLDGVKQFFENLTP